ncbi:MAG: RDD family protein [Nanobdellota archaeon]
MRSNNPNEKILGAFFLLRRAIAFIIDFIIVDFVVLSAFQPIIRNTVGEGSISELTETLRSSPGLVNQLSTMMFIASLLIVLYFTILEWKFSQTPGQRLMSLRVMAEGPRFWQYLLSNVFIFPFFPFILLWLIDPIYMVMTGRRLSERIAGLRMVQVV